MSYIPTYRDKITEAISKDLDEILFNKKYSDNKPKLPRWFFILLGIGIGILIAILLMKYL